MKYLFTGKLRICLLLVMIGVFIFNSASFALEQEKKSKKKKKKKVTEEVIEPEILTTTAQAGLPSDSYMPDSTDNSSFSGYLEWKINVRDDIDTKEISPKFRSWWYTKIEGINPETKSKIVISGDGWRGKEYVIPVYSYDRKTWYRFRPEEITHEGEENGYFTYSMLKKFDSSRVWIARYFPYSVNRLDNLIAKYNKSPFFKVEEIGKSSLGNPLKMITITDSKADDKNKKRIWVQCRTHPSETGSSFLLEGLIDFLMTECNSCCKNVDLSKLIFNIVPMVNIDGVIAGNSRLHPSGVDLERQWLRTAHSDIKKLNDTVAREVKIMSSKIMELSEKGPEFIIALNLHSTNSSMFEKPFLFSNFRKPLPEHGPEGDTMFIRQINFVRSVSKNYCADTFWLRTSYDPGLTMDKKIFPESWWWVNFKDKVMAGTVETTSGYYGCFEEWVTWRDHMKLGEAIALACQKYYEFFCEKKWFRYDAPSWNQDEFTKYLNENGAEK